MEQKGVAGQIWQKVADGEMSEERARELLNPFVGPYAPPKPHREVDAGEPEPVLDLTRPRPGASAMEKLRHANRDHTRQGRRTSPDKAFDPKHAGLTWKQFNALKPEIKNSIINAYIAAKRAEQAAQADND